MVLKSLMKNPVLMIGILMMSIFLMKLSSDESWTSRDKLNPTSCKAVLVKLIRRIPANWDATCKGNNLTVEINYPELKDKPIPKDKVRTILFMELANYMKKIALSSPSDNLERTDFVTLKLHHPKLSINALTEGKFIVKLATMKNVEMIKEHLKVTVQVQEISKP